MSNASTATNYAIGATFLDKLVPVRPELSNGPFLHDLKVKVPPVVLTKTHCTGFCDDCGPKNYVVANVEAFEMGCLTVHANLHSGEVATLQYEASVPTRAVHLIRNPFDNAVSRFHLSILNREWPVNFTSTKEGFREWCEFMAVTSGDSGLHDEVKELLRGIPCGIEFHRYVLWHNMATKMTKRMGIPVHYLYYESYTTDFNRTVDELFEFLEIEQVQEPLPFIPGKTYLSYYDDGDIEKIRRLVQSMATPHCWELLRVYFE